MNHDFPESFSHLPELGERFKSSWAAAESGFEEVLRTLRGCPPDAQTGLRLINESSGKQVWRGQAQGAGRCYDFAYKIQPGGK